MRRREPDTGAPILTAEELADLEHPGCPQCAGLSPLLGCLGNTHYHRCRLCGWTFELATPPPPEDDEYEDDGLPF
jgi:tRNA(Ile2) C34 agmatinyltransferase TiaS